MTKPSAVKLVEPDLSGVPWAIVFVAMQTE